MTENEHKKIREAACDLVDTFVRAMANVKPAAEPEAPKRVWECTRQDSSSDRHDYCGMAPSETACRDEDTGTPFFWHNECWSAYQIKTLRRILEKVRTANEHPLAQTTVRIVGAWKEVDKQLAALYPEERKDTP